MVDIRIEGQRIAEIKNTGDVYQSAGDSVIDFKGALVFPGLINSHDHLDFNLFPKLGNKVYHNYVEWGNDIHAKNKNEIEGVLRVPKDLRVRWGIYKNLLNGVTTVVNHGAKLNPGSDLITVWEDCYALHSVALEKYWRLKLNRPRSNKKPFVVHIGEGTDKSASSEIEKLLRWNLFRKKLVAVHGVAMTEQRAENFHALVWCPASNYFLLGKTAAIDKLKHKTKIIFGTDSAVSSDWNLWTHLKQAKESGLATDTGLYAMLTKTPAEVWEMKGHGQLAGNFFADLVVARKKEFSMLEPEDLLAVFHKGELCLYDEEMTEAMEPLSRKGNYDRIVLNGHAKHVKGDLAELVKAVRTYYPEAQFPFAIG